MQSGAQKSKSRKRVTNKRGRWSTEEEVLFDQGYLQHGRNWKKVQSTVRSRTLLQVRSHAQKYFMRQERLRNTDNNTKIQEGEQQPIQERVQNSLNLGSIASTGVPQYDSNNHAYSNLLPLTPQILFSPSQLLYWGGFIPASSGNMWGGSPSVATVNQAYLGQAGTLLPQSTFLMQNMFNSALQAPLYYFPASGVVETSYTPGSTVRS